MKILSADQIRSLDRFTIENEPIEPIELMERASQAFCRWFISKFSIDKFITVFAGTGNNGGDGLAIARILKKEGFTLEVLVIGDPEKGSKDFLTNLSILPKEIPVSIIRSENDLESTLHSSIIIDAIFGSGLNRKTQGVQAFSIEFVNQQKAIKVAVDIPSGLFCDTLNDSNDVITEADYTVTFQLPKLCFLLSENEKYVGDWSVVDIGLSEEFIEKTDTKYHFLLNEDIEPKVKKRTRFSHKGTYGHVLIVSGSYGKIGATILCSRACLKTGVGLLTVQTPSCGYEIIQISVPEAMCVADESESGRVLSTINEIKPYDVLGIGPGMGKAPSTTKFLEQLLSASDKPVVLDADALNILSENRHFLNLLPENSILTPHPKEFERLTRKAQHSLERLNLLQEFCATYRCITVLKGAFSATCTPEGQIFFNSTGNPGMATGGSGDVLTGIITSLVAQKYSPVDATMVGVYLHGYAGDKAAEKLSAESLSASDIIDNIFEFFKDFK
jgi:ADP-dependent NAD(P)H-hydrate dehydratase / NAD(P)H-hydrate epimerase